MNPDPRHISLEILLGCQSETTTLDHVIERLQDRIDLMSRQDRNLCHALVFGVLRNRGYLDHMIKAFSKIPFSKLDRKAVHLLRLALFQIIFLDRIPDFAAIDTTIELAKGVHLKKATGFLNAVLRKAALGYPGVELPGKEHSSARLAASLSFPPWLVKKWISAFGPDKTWKLCKAINRIPPLTLRVNTLKTDRSQLGQALTRADLDFEMTAMSSDGLCLSQPGTRVSDLPGYDRGWFQVQDEAAQLVSHIVAPRPGERILDACAGLGGKAFHMAQLMENHGKIIAMDIGERKLNQLNDEALRLGVDIIETRKLNVLKTGIKDFQTYFDRVLVDAPCTGLGVMRRNPDTKWKQSPRQILRMAAQQKKILNAAANLVRPGGTLVYAVCSCEPEENQAVIRSFLKKRKDYRPAPCPDNLFPYDADSLGGFKTYPNLLYMDGFFAARLLRAG